MKQTRICIRITGDFVFDGLWKNPDGGFCCA